MTSDRGDGLDALVRVAAEVRARAHAPYSGFSVGAALETTEGIVLTGCNVESASYGLTICAERVALVKAVSEGHRHFRRIAIVTASQTPASPCGACRQMLWELAGDLEVILAHPTGEVGRHRLADLLPLPFDRRALDA